MFSWGLDSLLAIKILESQNIDCTALTFITPFFGEEKAKKQAEKFWIKFMSKDISDIHFDIVKNPKYWYGKNLNPCIDCHGLMFHLAGKIAIEQWFDIVASWEVLGQRTMSQNKQSLNAVIKLAQIDILRPLSAKLLPETKYEKEWLIDRSQLLDIQWKWRYRQIELAKQFWLKDYEAPGGWCRLTEPWYADKLKSLLEKFPQDILPIDAEIIKYWKFKIFDRWFAVMWRDKESNQKLLDTKPDKKEYILLKLKETTWPDCLIKNIKNGDYIKDIKVWYKEKVSKLKDESFSFFVV